MFELESSSWLWGLLWLPVLILAYWLFLQWRQAAIKRFGEWNLVEKLMDGFSAKRQHLKFLLWLLTITFIILGLTNPQLGTRLEKVKRQGVDVVIALDVSKSMLAQDITPNRLERSKQFISKLLSRMADDRIALIIFAGNAYMQMPLTIDYSAAKLFLNTISTEIVPTQGTAIGEAIDLASQAFDSEEDKFKTLIIITDGENHEKGAITAAEDAREMGVLTYTVGVGSKDGGPIPIFRGKRITDYVRDKSGGTVVSKLNVDMLKDVAKAGNGQFFQLTNGTREIDNILDELSGMEKKEFEDRVFTDFEDQFQWLLGPALLLLIANLVFSERRKPKAVS